MLAKEIAVIRFGPWLGINIAVSFRLVCPLHLMFQVLPDVLMLIVVFLKPSFVALNDDEVLTNETPSIFEHSKAA